MGLLDSVTGALGGGGKGPQALLQKVLPMLTSAGGFEGILGKFRQAGLGRKVDSWIGTGPNEPLTGDEVEQALGTETIAGLAKDTGMDAGEVKGGLASMLPGLVDKLSPGGKVDVSKLGDLAKGLDLGSLGKLFGR
jgi:uncharacterized protein YidB (DUF937 family)